jgi:hypothetical protein
MYYSYDVNNYLGSFSERSLAEKALADIHFEDHDAIYGRTFGFIFSHPVNTLIDQKEVQIIGAELAIAKKVEWLRGPEGIAYSLLQQKKKEEEVARIEIENLYRGTAEYHFALKKLLEYQQQDKIDWSSIKY